MDETLREQIQNELSSRETDELINIWKQQNTNEWELETFEIIKEILLERLGEIPDISPIPAIGNTFQSKNIPDYQDINTVHKDFATSRERKIEFENSEAIELLDLAIESAEDEDFDLAVQTIESALPHISDTAIELTMLGEAWLTVKKPHEAFEVFERAIKLDQEYSRSRTGRRNALLMINEEPLQPGFHVDPAEAIAVEEQALEFSEKEFEKNKDTIEETPDWVYMSLESILIRGSAGFRNRSGRSGLDPLDSQMDESRFEGLLIRRLLTGHLRTHDPLYLTVMFVFGSICLIPLIFIAGTVLNYEDINDGISLFGTYLPILLFGLLLYYNLVQSFLSEEPDGFQNSNDKFF